MILETEGFDIIGKAYNGLEAVEMFKTFSKKPDVIIMDHRMPVMTGLDAAKEILEIDNTMKIIFATADSFIKEEAKAIGANSFKNKPFSADKLIRNIKKALRPTELVNHH